jgi:hypothetical protein
VAEYGIKDESPTALVQLIGSSSALELAYGLIRSFGVISSIGAPPSIPRTWDTNGCSPGVNTSATFPIPPPSLCTKSVSLAFGRSPVRALVGPASAVLQKYHHVFSACGFIDKVVPIGDEDAVEAYRAFDRG